MFAFTDFEKQLKKIVKSEYEEGYSSNLIDFLRMLFLEEAVLKNVSKTFKSIWRANPWMDPVFLFFIMPVLFLFFAGLVDFTVIGFLY